MIYLKLYNESIKQLIEMEQKKIIQLTNETKDKLNELYEQTETKFYFLLPFRKYNFQNGTIEQNEISNELFKIFLEHGNKNLIYGLKIKDN